MSRKHIGIWSIRTVTAATLFELLPQMARSERLITSILPALPAGAAKTAHAI
jgi:hypothetical protein